MKMKRAILLGVTIAAFTSCIPLKQYHELQDRDRENNAELKRLEQAYQSMEVDNNELNAEVKRLKEAVDALGKDTVRLAKQNWSLQNRNKELMAQYNDLMANSSALNATPESAKLLQNLQQLHQQLQDREDALVRAERELAAKKQVLETASANLRAVETELEGRNKRLFELERALNEKDSLMNALRTTVANALTDFGSDELAVHIKNGKVYVSMEEKLLFSSGSYQVSNIGVGALKKIAAVLEQKSDINVLVEGHTDDVPYKSAVLLDNWDLSVKRATSVTRIILQNSSVNASRVTAAGRSEFVPLDASRTTDARRKNRRTEIILSPNLDQVFDLLQTN